jgi:hypothetical protein
MGRRFDPKNELADAKNFRRLAKTFEHGDTLGLCERFSILAVLCEEKAKVLKELDEVSRTKTDAKTSGRLLEWPDLAGLFPAKQPGDN